MVKPKTIVFSVFVLVNVKANRLKLTKLNKLIETDEFFDKNDIEL